MAAGCSALGICLLYVSQGLGYSNLPFSQPTHGPHLLLRIWITATWVACEDKSVSWRVKQEVGPQPFSGKARLETHSDTSQGGDTMFRLLGWLGNLYHYKHFSSLLLPAERMACFICFLRHQPLNIKAEI